MEEVIVYYALWNVSNKECLLKGNVVGQKKDHKITYFEGKTEVTFIWKENIYFLKRKNASSQVSFLFSSDKMGKMHYLEMATHLNFNTSFPIMELSMLGNTFYVQYQIDEVLSFQLNYEVKS